MRVTTGTLIELVSKSDTAKDALDKTTITKTETLAKSDTAKPSEIKNIINNLLKELASNTKTKQNILQEIKQSDIPKLMKNTTAEISRLLTLIKSNKSVSKFEPILEKLLLHVKDIKPEVLKQELAKSGILLESKLATNKRQSMPPSLKEILTSLKEILNSPKQNVQVLKSIDVLLNTKKIDTAFAHSLQNLIKTIKTLPQLPEMAEPLLKKLDAFMAQKTLPQQVNMKELLTEVKQVLNRAAQVDALHVKSIERILDAPKADKGFISDIKTLIVDIKRSKVIDKPIVQIVAKLEEAIQKSSLVESRIQNNLLISPKETQKIIEQIKQILVEFKGLAKGSKKEPILEIKSQEIVRLVEQILKTPEFFPRELSKATISEKLQQIVNLIKSEFVKDDAKNSLHVELTKLTNSLEAVIKEQVLTKKIVPNQRLQTDMNIKQELSSDVKSVLLNIKQELGAQSTTVSREVSFQIDRILTQIDYFQLMTLSTNSFSSYLPFLWDGLQEGQVNLKKLKEKRFFCEINIKLKEYGRIDIMLMLFEDIYVNISVFAEKDTFLKLIQDNLQDLKQGINRLGLIPSTVQLKRREKDDEPQSPKEQLGTSLNIEA